MSARNMVAMFGAMAVLRRIDQEEPLVLLYARVGYLIYVGVTSLMYIMLHFRIIARRDTTLITVPVSQKTPSFTEAMEQARKTAEKTEAEKQRELENLDDDTQSTSSTVTTESSIANGRPNRRNQGTSEGDSGEERDDEGDAEGKVEEEKEQKMETLTVMEYDLRHLSNARRSWVTSSCFLAVVHFKMQSVSPLIMSAVMGFMRLLSEEPLVQIHLRGSPAVDKLQRPFAAEKNPLAAMFKDMAPKDGQAATTSSAAQIANGQAAPNLDDDLHDDGDNDDDDDDVATGAANMRDDHIKSDFDDDDEDVGESKKAQ